MKSPDLPTASSAADDKRRMMLLLAAFVLVFGVFYSIRPSTGSGSDAPVAALDAARRPPAPAVVRSLLAEWVRDDEDIDRVTIDQQALEHVWLRAAALMDVHVEEGEQDLPSAEALETSRADRRGEVFRVRGTLSGLHTERRGDLEGTWGTLHTDVAGPVRFAAARPAPEGLEVGDTVRLDGYFLKWFTWEEPVGQWNSGPLLVGNRLVASMPAAEAVLDLDPAVIDAIVDDTAQNAAPEQGQLYFHFLAHARDLAAEDREALRKAPEFTETVFDSLVEDPAAFRGRPFRIYGQLADMFGEPLGENPLRTQRQTTGWLMNGNWGVAKFVSPLRFAGHRRHDDVIVTGWFYRRHAYEGADNAVHLAPVFVAATVETMPEPDTSAYDNLFGLIVGGIVVLTGGLAWLIRRDRREARDWQERVLKRRRAARGST